MRSDGWCTHGAIDRAVADASFKTLRETADLRHLRQIIAGLDEGVILIDPDQTLLWANRAALAMHEVDELRDLGTTVDEYRARFQLRYRNNHRLKAVDYPIDRVVAGDSFAEVVVEVSVAGEDEPRWVHQVRSLVLNDADDGEPACLVLVIQDVSAQFEAEDRFEQSRGGHVGYDLVQPLDHGQAGAPARAAARYDGSWPR
jgi:PAS domain-containing protein